jgi:hypothetical protein
MKTKILNLAATMVVPAALLAFTSCSSTSNTQTENMNGAAQNSAAAPEITRGGVVLDAMTATATVQSINPDDRTVVLQYPDGSVSTYECGSEVRNFDQIKVGDQVTATVAESVAIGLVKGGMPIGAGTSSAIVRAPLGARPAGKIVDTVGFTAKVVSVDAANRKVTLQTVDGQNQTVKVGPDINLANVNPGDDVGVRVTRAFAIEVTPPAAPAQ